jgi:hypothetical protein
MAADLTLACSVSELSSEVRHCSERSCKVNSRAAVPPDRAAFAARPNIRAGPAMAPESVRARERARGEQYSFSPEMGKCPLHQTGGAAAAGLALGLFGAAGTVAAAPYYAAP